MWIRVCGVKSGRLINFIVLPLGGAMVIDPIDFMCNHHLTPTRGGMETVNRNLNGAYFSLEIEGGQVFMTVVHRVPSPSFGQGEPYAVHPWSVRSGDSRERP